MIDSGWAAYRDERYADAASQARAALTTTPGDARALHLLGMTAHATGDDATAVDAMYAAARSAEAYAELFVDFGRVLLHAGRPRDAATAFRAAIGRGGGAPALLGLGHALRDAGNTAEARAAYEQAFEADPSLIDAPLSHGTMLLDRGDSLAALDALRGALKVHPNEPQLALTAALAAVRIGAFEEAREVLRPLDAAGETPEVQAMQGLIALESGDLAEAESKLVAAVNVSPALHGARINLARLREMQRNHGAVEELFAGLLADHPDSAHSRIARAMARLRRGDYAGGWEDYRAIYDPSILLNPSPYRDTAPVWTGEPVERLAIVRDQGLGDFIQMLRFIPEVSKRCSRLLLEAPASAFALASRVSGIGEMRVESGAGCAFSPTEFDAYVPLMRLPGILRIGLDDLPFARRYLQVDPVRSNLWRKRIGERDGTLRLGLLWSGNPRLELNRRRDIAGAELLEAVSAPGVSVYSLQYGGTALPGITDLGKDIEDLSDTAAAMSELDLIVGVDTGPMHVAGALDLPAILLLHPDADWRWLQDRDDSPWYPSISILRRAHGGDWSAVFARLRDRIEREAHERIIV